MPSPPKPWEVNSGTAVASTPVVSEQAMAEPTTDIPTVPNRPSTMNTGTAGFGTTAGMGGYGSTSYGGLGGTYGSGYGGTYGSGYGGTYGSGYGGTYGSSYNSPYSRMGMSGGYGGGYGSYGGYGGMSSYNRFGSTGYNQFGNGGMFGGGPDDFSLTQRMETSTRATFGVIESIVGAFGGFAQMLDSTYMATHSSFMAMVGVAEQFGYLKHYLGGIFSIFALIRWVKRLMYRLTGRTPPAELLTDTSQQQQQQDESRQITAEGETEEQQQVVASVTEGEQATEEQPITKSAAVSRKRPILIFLALVTGLPYIIYKLIQRSTRLRQQRMMIPQYGGPPPEVARVIHDFVAENPIELTIRRGEMVHVLSKVDPATGGPCDWWQGRSANGSIGIFPANYVQIEQPGY